MAHNIEFEFTPKLKLPVVEVIGEFLDDWVASKDGFKSLNFFGMMFFITKEDTEVLSTSEIGHLTIPQAIEVIKDQASKQGTEHTNRYCKGNSYSDVFSSCCF